MLAKFLNRLLHKHRRDEAEFNCDRADRFHKKGDFWYFRTREGLEIGPFDSRSDAHYALLFFVERAQWPTNIQLKNFISGCELLHGVSL